MSEETEILRAFADELRLRILRLIAERELFVTELVDVLQMSQPRVSRHLAVLRRAGLVRDRRDGNWVYYRMLPGELTSFAGELWQAVRGHVLGEDFHPADAERLDEVVSRRKARSRAYFDQVASEWDRIKRDYIQDMLPFLVVANLIRPGDRAVDIGTGTGEVLVSLAGTAGQVVGVDNSAKMLDACRRRIDDAGLDNVELRRGDAESLPLDDAECDSAFASMVLHHLPDPAGGVREMARVLRPGGRVVIVDLVKHAHDWTREAMADLWLGFTEPQIRAYLDDAGFIEASYSTTRVAAPTAAESGDKLKVFVAAARRAGDAGTDETKHATTTEIAGNRVTERNAT